MVRQAIRGRKREAKRTPHEELVVGNLKGFVQSVTIPHRETGDIFLRGDEAIHKIADGIPAYVRPSDLTGLRKRSSDMDGSKPVNDQEEP